MRIDDEVIFAVALDCVGDEVVVVGHRVELELYFSDILLQQHHHVTDLLLGPRLILKDCQTDLDGHVVRVVIRNKLQLISVHPQSLDLAFLALKDKLHFLSHLLRSCPARHVLFS